MLEPIGCEVVVAGADFRFGRGRSGDLALLRSLGFDVRVAREVAAVSSTRIRELLHAGDLTGAAGLLGRPYELDGTVVAGNQRGGTLGYPTANLAPPAGAPRPALRDLRRPRARTPRPLCRSASTRTTAAPSGGSSRTSSTSRATCTASGSCSSSGSTCAKSAPSPPRRSSSPRSAATSRPTRHASRPA